MHETAERAHVFRPAAAFAEKEGTFTNSERRVQRVRKALEPRGQARADWWITSELAKRVARRLGVRVDGQFDYANAADVFDEMARLTPFLGGISHARLDREGGLRWPCPTADHPGTRFLYAESFPRGKGKFIPAVQTVEAAELPDPDYPLILNTGRLLYHWHGGTITRRVDGLMALAPRLEVAIHPADAGRLGIGDGDGVRVTSRRGELTGDARVSTDVRPGAIFVPFVKLQESAANFLTNAAFDPASKIPEYKVCAVRVELVSGSASPPPRQRGGRWGGCLIPPNLHDQSARYRPRAISTRTDVAPAGAPGRPACTRLAQRRRADPGRRAPPRARHRSLWSCDALSRAAPGAARPSSPARLHWSLL